MIRLWLAADSLQTCNIHTCGVRAMGPQGHNGPVAMPGGYVFIMEPVCLGQAVMA